MFDWGVILSNARFVLLQGLVGIGQFGGGTLKLAIPAMILGFTLGVLAGLARMAQRRWLHLPAAVYIEGIRSMPIVMVVFWFYFFIPLLSGARPPEYWIALTAFVIFEAAYLAEIVRAGIQSVPRGQIDAAVATGLGYRHMMQYVVLPQAVRNMIPSLVTQFIVLFKDTSVASIIGMMELTKAAQAVSQRELRPFEMYLFIAVVYWLCTYSLSRLSRRLEVRMAH